MATVPQYLPPQHPLYEVTGSDGDTVTRWFSAHQGLITSPAQSVSLGFRRTGRPGLALAVTFVLRRDDEADARFEAAFALHTITRPEDVGVERLTPTEITAEMERIARPDDWLPEPIERSSEPPLGGVSLSWRGETRRIQLWIDGDLGVAIVTRGLEDEELVPRRVTAWDSYGIELDKSWTAAELTDYRSTRPVHELELGP